MSFHDVRFPVDISLRANGGPGRRTQVVALASGKEERNASWADSRREYDVGLGLRSVDDVSDTIAFFEARLGRLYAFRFKDWADFKSTKPGQTPGNADQLIGTGDGQTASFQLVKTYADAAGSYVRDVTKPVFGTVLVAVNGVGKIENTHFTVDHLTGMITFTGGNIPASGQAVTAGFEFDVPVRFVNDKLALSLETHKLASIGLIPLIEVRE